MARSERGLPGSSLRAAPLVAGDGVLDLTVLVAGDRVVVAAIEGADVGHPDRGHDGPGPPGLTAMVWVKIRRRPTSSNPLCGGITGYTHVVAKVMVSLPDDLLHSLDAEAERRKTTRSGLLRDYVHEGLRRRAQERAGRVRQLLSAAGHHGANSVGDLKRHRPVA